jgi:FixJ family two-component response regulator
MLMSTQSKIVAIVDDDPSMLRGLARLLTTCGFEPAAYESAEAFWERHLVINAICVVLDIHLPGMSGIELRRRLTEADPALPVIFMTADDSELVRMAANAAGCVACLRKPFPGQVLIDAIEKAAA